MNKIAKFIAVAALLAPLPGYAAEPAKPTDAPAASASAMAGLPAHIKKGDSKLTCPQILAEARAQQTAMDTASAQLENSTTKPSARTNAITAGAGAIAALGGMLPGPLGSLAAAPGSVAQIKSMAQDMKSAERPLQEQVDYAMDRMDYLYSMHERKCLKRK